MGCPGRESVAKQALPSSSVSIPGVTGAREEFSFRGEERSMITAGSMQSGSEGSRHGCGQYEGHRSGPDRKGRRLI